jgi:small subunit ribosomal protein S16
MLKIKLSPFGKKHEPHYRIVVVEAHSKLTGKSVNTLGHYHPLSHQLVVNRDLVKEWIGKGAQPTGKIRQLLKLKS